MHLRTPSHTGALHRHISLRCRYAASRLPRARGARGLASADLCPRAPAHVASHELVIYAEPLGAERSKSVTATAELEAVF